MLSAEDDMSARERAFEWLGGFEPTHKLNRHASCQPRRHRKKKQGFAQRFCPVGFESDIENSNRVAFLFCHCSQDGDSNGNARDDVRLGRSRPDEEDVHDEAAILDQVQTPSPRNIGSPMTVPGRKRVGDLVF